MSDTIPKLQAEIERLRERIRQRNRENDQDQNAVVLLRKKLHRHQLLDAVGQPGTVRLLWPFPAGHEHAKYNGVPGTVLEVRRSLCVVDFGDGQRWHMKLDMLCLVGESETVVIGAEG